MGEWIPPSADPSVDGQGVDLVLSIVTRYKVQQI